MSSAAIAAYDSFATEGSGGDYRGIGHNKFFYQIEATKND
jgi:hypothetical protein